MSGFRPYHNFCSLRDTRFLCQSSKVKKKKKKQQVKHTMFTTTCDTFSPPLSPSRRSAGFKLHYDV